ncbi:MAG: Na+/H+ antiporter subunit E [Gammaproteobacteria bacterium]
MSAESAEPRLTLAHYTLVFLVLWLFWMLLADSRALEEAVAGAVVSALVTLVSRRHLVIFAGVRTRLTAPVHLLVYLFHFLLALIRANVDLALRVIRPSLPIDPAVVELTTRLQSPLGRMLLANSITLTPGTLTVDLDGERLLVHCVYCPESLDHDAMTRKVFGRFEQAIGGFLK